MEEDVNYWLRQFGGESALAEFLRREQRDASPAAESKEAGEPDAKSPAADDDASDKPAPGELDDLANPFPPGYGEDLLDGDADV